MPAQNYRRIEDTTDAEGFIIPGYSAWDCTATAYRKECGAEVRRYRGESDVSCTECGAWYNASGQRLRDDWRGNASNYDDEIGDLEGFEAQHAGDW
ncbi:hypothetical protein SEA_SEMPERFI_92 [Mycobacterium phage SemperFi]|uniref:Uncharacterized protein n=1 Tax=Mycobacterium phage Georgie2 TaxID=2743928 RepID=A0A7D5JJC4_9CAUD|nr:hypothetical protein PBI_SWEETIEPIE_92 [Mycobacterium phage SweetiePie]YP_010063900.1 hypothetical protein KIY84_gp93 [Mycobacterium phage Georgie2]AIS73855.1 hypothetical protein PBI_POWER_92 [Mycobacterium phage Power]ATN91937.1 hypothetical protein SEA_SNAPTAP_92 [Mycobacterium phage SnapTap]AXC33241.1 hypothetical protein SEA_CRUCIO_92 [Mycobacterium phage Crucio]AXQ53018.1 hypothetical protein SEA_QUEENBEESLY_92 [Mycobacterium phage QueenBeesly]QFG11891.1 hypothetical protein SEA_SEMP